MCKTPEKPYIYWVFGHIAYVDKHMEKFVEKLYKKMWRTFRGEIFGTFGTEFSRNVENFFMLSVGEMWRTRFSSPKRLLKSARINNFPQESEKYFPQAKRSVFLGNFGLLR